MKKTSVDIIIPVLNEEKILVRNIGTLEKFLKKQKHWNWKIVIIDNGSTDQTNALASKLHQKNKKIKLMRLAKKGRGRALKLGFIKSKAQVRCYMDVDLSTRLKALPQLVDAVAKENYDIAIGSRLITGAKVEGRSLLRELLSRGYNLLVQIMFPGLGIKDMQCGFKAIGPRVARDLLPRIKDKKWFFDSELLVLAHYWKARIVDIPVHWKDDSDSRVKIVRTVMDNLQGLLRLRFLARPKKPQSWKS